MRKHVPWTRAGRTNLDHFATAGYWLLLLSLSQCLGFGPGAGLSAWPNPNGEAMSRKHFQSLADRMRAVRPDWHEGTQTAALQRAQWLVCVQAVADVCSEQNARFDRTRFLDACGALEAR